LPASRKISARPAKKKKRKGRLVPPGLAVWRGKEDGGGGGKWKPTKISWRERGKKRKAQDSLLHFKSFEVQKKEKAPIGAEIVRREMRCLSFQDIPSRSKG